MTAEPVYLLGVEAALALVEHYLEPPYRLGDARLFTAGRLSLWRRWPVLPDDDCLRIARFLRLRPEALGEDATLRRWGRRALDRAIRFRWQDARPQNELHGAFERVAGKPAVALADELLDLLERRSAGSGRRTVEVDGGDHVFLRAGRLGFTIPATDLPRDQIESPEISVASESGVSLKRERLLQLAERLDATGVSPVPYRRVLDEILLPGLEVGDGQPFGQGIEVSPGPTQLFIAPTGRGKSVFTRLAAIDLASRGARVAIAVPDIKTVLAEAHQTQRCADALGLGLQVVPVNAARNLFAKTVEALEHPPPHDDDGRWTLETLGYFCQLAAYADDEPPGHGAEPCTSLSQRVGERSQPVSCPFVGDCPKFDQHRLAPRADILVVNHHALLTGRMPTEIGVERGPVTKMSVLELVLRSSSVILIDEIDQFQGTAIRQGTGSLRLTSGDAISPLHELFEEFERKKASDAFPLDARFTRLRRSLMLVRWLTEELADSINGGEVRWGYRDSMRWSRARDGWLARKLFGHTDNAPDQLETLFAEDAISEDTTAERVRQVVRRWTHGSLDEEEETAALRAELGACIDDWNLPVAKAQDRTRASIVDALIIRAILARLERSLSYVRSQLPLLEQHGVAAASSVREKMVGYVPWRPSPLGALGRRVTGFSFYASGEDPGALHAQAITGDPHDFVAGLGDETALALGGGRRVVLGLSATGRFAGSPKADVQAPIVLAQKDHDAASSMVVEPVILTDEADGAPVRVSGVPVSRGRRARAARLASLLWDQVLSRHLLCLREDENTKDRARALLVTGSYPECEAVAAALASEMPDRAEAKRRLRYMAKSKDSPAIPTALLPREIETFGETDADILVAPLNVVARGHNILQPGSHRSAIASIFVMVRPVPPVEDAEAALAHVSYDACRRRGRTNHVRDAIEQERRRAEQQLRFLQQSSGPFSRLPVELRHQLLCDVLVDIAQLAGRARRGGTDVRLYLVDGAFHDEDVGWRALLRESFETWEQEGTLEEMFRLHGSLLRALHRFAGLEGK